MMPSCRCLGVVWGRLGASRARLGAVWGHLGAILGRLGAARGRLGAVFGPSRGVSGRLGQEPQNWSHFERKMWRLGGGPRAGKAAGRILGPPE